MVYQYKMPGLFPVSAQVAGEELRRINDRDGCVRPEVVVNDSRPEDAPLHPVFEWDDPTAAELYRAEQARGLIRCVVTVEEKGGAEPPVKVRVYEHVQSAYYPTSVILSEAGMRAELLGEAVKAMKAFRQRFSRLSELATVFAAMDESEQKIGA